MKTGIQGFALIFFFSLSLILTVHTGCSPKFDQFAYENVRKLQTELPKVMNLATKPYLQHEEHVAFAKKMLIDAESYTTTAKRNKDLTEAYRILSRDLVEPFFSRWKEKETLDREFIHQAVKQVTNSLDAIERAEKSKRK